MAWHKIAILGLLAGGIAVGCTVTSSDGSDGDDAGNGGGDDAAAGGAAATGGASGSGGAAATGGGSSGGATGAGGATPDAGPATCDPGAAPNDCQACVETKCCEEYLACNDTVCAGSGSTKGELECFQDCMQAAVDAGISQDTVLDCSGQCAAAGSVLGDNTQELVTCILSGDTNTPDGGTAGCSVECYDVDLTL